MFLTLFFVSLSPWGDIKVYAGDPFTVSKIIVEDHGETALQAREKALKSAQIKAVQRLMDRLVMQEDQKQKILSRLKQSDILPLISGVQIDREKYSQTRYLGALTISFNARAVGSLLKRYGVAAVSGPGPTYLLAPVWQNSQGYVLWDPNPWLEAWKDLDLRYEFLSIDLLPSQADSSALRDVFPAKEVVQDRAEAFSHIADLYKTNRIIVVLAKEEGAPFQQSSDAEGPGLESQDEGSVVLEVKLIAVFPYASEKETLGVFKANSFDEAAREAFNLLQTRWKEDTLAYTSQPTRMIDVRVFYRSLQEWNRLRGLLSHEPMIKEIHLRHQTRSKAALHLSVQGEMENLQKVLGYNGFILHHDLQGHYDIMPDEKADF